MGERTYENGDERRTMSYGENADGTVFVRQASEGDLTQFFFDCDRYVVTLTFEPSAAYGLGDVEDDLDRRGDDCYITDYAEALELWGVEFSETQEREVLAA